MANQTETLVNIFNTPAAMHVIQEQIKWDTMVKYDITLEVAEDDNDTRYTFTFRNTNNDNITTIKRNSVDWIWEVFNDATDRAEVEGEEAPEDIDDLNDMDNALAIVSLVS